MADSKKLYPRTGDTQTIYLKNAITSPDIVVGDYTMYNDFADNPIKFEQNNVLYHCLRCEISFQQCESYNGFVIYLSIPSVF